MQYFIRDKNGDALAVSETAFAMACDIYAVGGANSTHEVNYMTALSAHEETDYVGMDHSLWLDRK